MAEEKLDPTTGEVVETVDGRHDKDGREYLDPRPSHLAVRRARRVDAMTAQIQALVREEVSRAAAKADFETFEEANDFEIEDDYDPTSPHEIELEDELDGFKKFREDVVDAARELFRKKEPSGSPQSQPAPVAAPEAE